MEFKKFEFGKVKVYSNLCDVDKDEAKRYLDFVDKNADFNHEEFAVAEVYVEDCQDGTVNVDYVLKANRKFERIRRVTGYLSGDLNTWNDAKRAEESERVKHGLQEFLPNGSDEIE